MKNTITKYKTFDLIEVRPNIFLMKFKNSYDLCMTFLRYQEFYENANPKFRGKSFTILDFMDWYTKDKKGFVFTYTIDWAGFNIPGHIIMDVRKAGIKDPNQYDQVMKDVHSVCCAEDFYLIGMFSGSPVFEHEIAHGYFYTNQSYRREMKKLVSALPTDLKKQLYKVLTSMGYAKSVHTDEIQAYFATGPSEAFKNIDIGSANEPFMALFDTYCEECAI